MPNIQWSSDLHLDACSDEIIFNYLDSINPDMDLIITGDISIGTRIESDLVHISSRMGTGKVYVVLGNHDYYQATINQVRYQLKYMLQAFTNIFYLPDNGPIKLNDEWSIVGVDGWADARAGNFQASPSLIKDYQVIHDFIGKSDQQKQRILGRLGEEEAFRLKDILSREIKEKNVLIATHVPPYEQAHVYEGAPASYIYTPHFVCKSTGEVIDEYSKAHPDKNIKVICGHTHQAFEYKKDNITVNVAGATYSNPVINIITL